MNLRDELDLDDQMIILLFDFNVSFTFIIIILIWNQLTTN